MVSSGVISGTPTTVGAAHFTAEVSDASTPTPQSATAALSITVDRAATSTHLAASDHAALPHHAVTYIATVARSGSGTGVPTGTVAFSDGAARLQCVGGSQILHGAGVATCTITYRARGRHLIIATYQGDASFTGSQSHALSGTVASGRHHPRPTRALQQHQPGRSESAGGAEWRVLEGARPAVDTGGTDRRR
jgi:Big-like domain-containing protein